MEITYLVIFHEGMDAHILNECPDQSNLDHEDVVYIRITSFPMQSDTLLFEQYSTTVAGWVKVTQ